MHGLTIIELVVVCSTAAIIFTLLLAAIIESRRASLRTRCANNLRSLNVALQSHVTSHGSFPKSSNYKKAYSLHTTILPYIDESEKFNSLNITLLPNSPANATVAKVVINTFICPSDPSIISKRSYTNYAGSSGFGFQVYQTFNGVFVRPRDEVISPSSISDGSSNTICMSEWVSGINFDNKHPNNLASAFDTKVRMNKSDQLEQFAMNCQNSSIDQFKKISSIKGVRWLDGSCGRTIYNHVLPINSRSCLNNSLVMEGAWSASSKHSSGANSMFADGHVVFMKETTSLNVWRSLSTRSGQEIVHSDDY